MTEQLKFHYYFLFLISVYRVTIAIANDSHMQEELTLAL